MITRSPARLVQQHAEEIQSHLPGVFDADTESVHRARIATRRLREVLPLVQHPHTKRLMDTLRATGRELGRVRDVDVMCTLIDSMSDRVPTAGALELHALRRAVREQQRVARRTMIKQLERLELRELSDVIARDFTSTVMDWLQSRLLPNPTWTRQIWAHILERSAGAVRAVEHSPAVYFPRRSHNARVAVKKLRYAIEVAADTGLWQPQRVLKDLRKIQTILGDVHDLQVLIDLARESVPALPSSEQHVQTATSPLTEVLQAEINRLYGEYARRRERIVLITDACARAANRSGWQVARPLALASAVAAPVLFAAIRQSGNEAPPPKRRRRKPVTPALHQATT